MSDLLSVSEALRRLLEAFSPVESECLPVEAAAGRVLAEDLSAGLDLPPFDNSAMDGFAVRAADLAPASRTAPVRLRVAADAAAGVVVDYRLQPGEAVRIMTGAPMPPGADAVIPVEDTDFNYRTPGKPAPDWVQVYRPVSPAENVRPLGQDLAAGQAVLSAGRRLRPQDIGFLAMLGAGDITVYRKPQVAIFSSGDELAQVRSPLEPGKIYDSNSYTLAALVEKYGGRALPLGVAADQAQAVTDVLDRALEAQADMIVSSAGVSVGAFDFVREVLEERGRLTFWRVNMRPGKPVAFGEYRGLPFVGLPGNPVSAFVGFEVFVRPALLKLAGLAQAGHLRLPVRLEEPVESDGRESYLRAVVRQEDGAWLARLTGHQGSGNMHSLVQANALLIIESGVKSLPVGSEVQAWLFDGPSAGFQSG